MNASIPTDDIMLRSAFEKFVANPDWPCVGAKAALSKDQMTILSARDFCSAWDDVQLQDVLAEFACRVEAEPKVFTSLAVIFRGPRELSEVEFEQCLWARLQSIHDKDMWRGYLYDTTVDDDPASPHFSFSAGGKAFFVIGLHPQASRKARRFMTPTLVFNYHAQFEMLREDGRYARLHDSIVARDIDFSGSANPMLAKHGEASAARQYSGRRAGPGWRCPFHPRTRREPFDDL